MEVIIIVEKIAHLKISLFTLLGVIFYVSIKYTVRGVKHDKLETRYISFGTR